MNNILTVVPKGNQSVRVIVPDSLQYICSDTTQENINTAVQRAEWSWWDICIAFKEIGYNVTQEEEQRIKRVLATRKLKGILEKEMK